MSSMRTEAQLSFEGHRATLAQAGTALHARLEFDQGGLLCTYREGVIWLALPDPELPGGGLRAALLSSLLGLCTDEFVWMYRAQLSRIVAHEIGHALRDEASRCDPNPWQEEQLAERLAWLLWRPQVSISTMARLREIVGLAAHRLGGLAEALGSHRLAGRARALPEFAGMTPVVPSPERCRDFNTFLRVSIAWGYLDLLLDPEDDYETYRNDALLAG